MTKNIFLVLASLLLSLSIFAQPAKAQSCTNQYGENNGCTPVDLTINKQVQNPTDGSFIENLNISNTTFASGSTFTFRVTIKNSSGETFTSIKVRDVLPEGMTFVSGPAGSTYTAEGRHLDWIIDSLPSGDSRTFEIVAKLTVEVSSNECLTNYAVVSSPQRPNGDDDTAKICLTTGNVLGATTLPVSGVNDLWTVVAFAVLGLGGVALIREK